MKKEKIEENIKQLRTRIKEIDGKYAAKRAELDKAHNKEISSLKEKEKFMSDKLKAMETEEKMKLVSKIPFDRLKEFASELEKDRKNLEEKRTYVADAVASDSSTTANEESKLIEGGNTVL